MIFYSCILMKVVFIAVMTVFIIDSAYSLPSPLHAVMVTNGYSRVFEMSVSSALKYLAEIGNIYVIAPKAKDLKVKFGKSLGSRVIFVDESTFPFNWANVSNVMYDAVKERGKYPLAGKTPFESTIYGKTGWFLQQLIKLYAGTVLGIGDYVLLDSDLVWMNTVNLINKTVNGLTTYNYATSTQYHPPYVATMTRISGVGVYESKDKLFRSGVVHHMVISKIVMQDLVAQTERRFGLPFWQVMLNESALELTCRAPRLPICGAGSTLSEYEMYLNYARQKFPETVNIRPLLWANGPMPGLLFWPNQIDKGIVSDGPKHNYKNHRQAETMTILEKQITADSAQGYHYIGYHSYAKRRYFELHGVDIAELCRGVAPPRNTTCSWNGLSNDVVNKRTVADWFQGCGCYMANHQS